jgi:glyoxylase-like metal-dependent hydrolase (beta-lactamase superfamily II)
MRLLSGSVLLGLLLALPLQAGDQVENRGADTQNWWDKLPRAEWSAFEQLDAVGNWFEVYRITPQVYALYEPGQFEEVISFLIVGSQRALLFDTGLGIGDIRAEVEQLTSLDITVLNSHTHYDHVGGNFQFDQRWARDTEFGRQRMKGLTHELVAEAVQAGWIWKPTPPSFDPARYVSTAWEFEHFVDEGMQIDLGGLSLEVIYTPGHAPDCISLLDRHNRVLFTGDTFYLAPLYSHLEGSSFSDYVASASKLAVYQPLVDTLITSHNVPTADASYLEHLHTAMQRIVAGKAEYVDTDGAREYAFDGFSVITHSPPQ